jgi:hypothetical protein
MLAKPSVGVGVLVGGKFNYKTFFKCKFTRNLTTGSFPSDPARNFVEVSSPRFVLIFMCAFTVTQETRIRYAGTLLIFSQLSWNLNHGKRVQSRYSFRCLWHWGILTVSLSSPQFQTSTAKLRHYLSGECTQYLFHVNTAVNLITWYAGDYICSSWQFICPADFRDSKKGYRVERFYSTFPGPALLPFMEGVPTPSGGPFLPVMCVLTATTPIRLQNSNKINIHDVFPHRWGHCSSPVQLFCEY